VFVCVFLGGKIAPNFDLKNMISTYTKNFPWKSMTQICGILKKKESKSLDFYDKFQ
jgi:hypothetical protein